MTQWHTTIRYTQCYPASTPLQNFQACPKTYYYDCLRGLSKELLWLQRSFCACKDGRLRKEKTDCTFNYLYQKSSKNAPECWFCVYPGNRTGREADKRRPSKRKSKATGNDFTENRSRLSQKLNWLPSGYQGFQTFSSQDLLRGKKKMYTEYQQSRQGS